MHNNYVAGWKEGAKRNDGTNYAFYSFAYVKNVVGGAWCAFRFQEAGQSQYSVDLIAQQNQELEECRKKYNTCLSDLNYYRGKVNEWTSYIGTQRSQYLNKINTLEDSI